MRNRVSGALGVLVAGGIVLAALPAAAKVTVTKFKLRAGSLIANFQGASDDGCFISETTVTFSEAVIFQSGAAPTTQPPTTQVTLDYTNACTGESLHLEGGTTQQSFQIAGDLGKASLIATVPVADPDTGGNNANVTLDVTWTANAPVQRSTNTTVSQDPSAITVDRNVVRSRTADVVGPVSTVLMLQAGPTFVDLSRFPQGGTVGTDNDGTRTVTYLGHP